VDRRHFIAGGVALWAAAPQLAVAQAGWTLLGSRTVNWASGRDSIMVSRSRSPFSALSFRARGSEIFLTSVEVSFAQGGRERLPVNMRLRSNLPSNSIRLSGPAREIRRVDFRFRRATPGGTSRRTTVQLFGRR
jgi:hypothetical protein